MGWIDILKGNDDVRARNVPTNNERHGKDPNIDAFSFKY